MDEFDLINTYFNRDPNIGNDCAVIEIPTGYQLCVTTDTLINGVHFPENTAPADIGFKVLAVSLSDLASCAAVPAFVTLNLTLPTLDEKWLAEFSQGFYECADAFNVKLVGGDTTKGPLSITVTANGYVKTGCAMPRNGATASEGIYVTGNLGDAALYLAGKLESNEARLRLDRPTPRVGTGIALQGLATS